MIVQLGLFGLGTATAMAGAHVGYEMLRGDRMQLPTQLWLFTASVALGQAALVGGAIGGFFLFGWWWLAILAISMFIVFGFIVDFLKARNQADILGYGIPPVWIIGSVTCGLTLMVAGAYFA